MTMGNKLKSALSQDFENNKKHTSLTSGSVIKILREKNQLSQTELAERTGLTQATISSIENNRISVGIDRAKTLATALNVHPSVIAFPDWNTKKMVA